MAEEINIISELEHIEAVISAARDRAKALQAEVDRLEQSLKLARGTGDQVEAAQHAVQMARPPILARMESVLREAPMDAEALSRALGDAPARVAEVLQSAATSGLVYNVGRADKPVWTWRIGPGSGPATIRGAVMRLISYQPMTFSELKAATGCSDNQVQGALIEIRRKVPLIHNLGTHAKARYFILPEDALDAKLQPKR